MLYLSHLSIKYLKGFSMESKGSMTTVVIITLIIGGIIGGLIGRSTVSSTKEETTAMEAKNGDAMMEKEGDAMMAADSSKASDLRANLRLALAQHVDLAAAATRNGFDGDADFDASAKELDKNSVAIAAAIGSVYGKEAETKFLGSWRSHIGFFVDYTVAAKAGDKAKMDQAVADLMGYIEGASTFLSTANPNLPKETLKKAITEHVLQLKGAVDAHGAKDYAKSYALQSEAYNHMGKLADVLAAAIVKQFPEKFK
jgi:hypothetical protein